MLKKPVCHGSIGVKLRVLQAYHGKLYETILANKSGVYCFVVVAMKLNDTVHVGVTSDDRGPETLKWTPC